MSARLRLLLRSPEPWLFLLLFASAAYFFPRWADWNQNSRFALVRAIVEEGRLTIDSFVHTTGDYAWFEGHAYSDKAPGTAFASVPVYAALVAALPLLPAGGLGGLVRENPALADTVRPGAATEERAVQALALYLLALWAGVLPTALAGVLLYRWLRWATPAARPRAAVALAYGLATPAFAYAWSFYGHQLAAALLLAGTALLAGPPRAARSPSLLALLAAGFALGAAVVVEYPAALLVAVVVGWVLARALRPAAAGGWDLAAGRRSAGGLLLGALPPALLLGAYQWAAFGSPWELGYRYSALWQAQHGVGLLSLTAPHLDALWGITFDPFRGLFVRSPLLLLALAGLAAGLRRPATRPWALLCALCSAAYLLFNASSGMWWGGFAAGPRYLLPALPFLAAPLAVALASRPARLAARGWLLAGPLPILLAAVSLLVVWAEALGGQSFPPEQYRNPLVEVALPALARGEVARNLGMVLGLGGLASLLPLLPLAALLLLRLWQTTRPPAAPPRTEPRRTLPGREEARPALAVEESHATS